MLKKMLYFVMSVVACIGLSTSIASATANCGTVSVIVLGTTPYTASGLFVKITNKSGETCFGDLDVGGIRQFFLAEQNANATYATLLTALSLEKDIFIQVGGDGVTNSLLLVAAIKNIPLD